MVKHAVNTVESGEQDDGHDDARARQDGVLHAHARRERRDRAHVIVVVVLSREVIRRGEAAAARMAPARGDVESRRLVARYRRRGRRRGEGVGERGAQTDVKAVSRDDVVR